MNEAYLAQVRAMKEKGFRYEDIVEMEPHLREAADQVFDRCPSDGDRTPVDVTPGSFRIDIAEQMARLQAQQGGSGSLTDLLMDSQVEF